MNATELYALYLKQGQATTDSRDCPAGSIFFALKGESFNGNKFAAAALEKGCSYAVVDEAEYAIEGDARYILVPDVLQAFKDMAREHRRRFDIPVIGITGTNGKTTTKELIAAVLERRYDVLYTQGNFNNDVGVPKTLLRLEKQHEIAVIEMGASHPGDIKTLVETVEPTCGLITNVGKAHLQGFGSFEGVMRTKGELYDYLHAHHCEVFANRDNPYLEQMRERAGIDKATYYGQSDDATIATRGELIDCTPFLHFRWQWGDGPWHEVETHLIGAYNLDNMLAAIAIGMRFGVSPEQISEALANYIPSNNRSQLDVTAHNKLIVDAYNANPTSMAAAIQNFSLIRDEHKMAILGDMRELGEASAEEHQKMVELIAGKEVGRVWLVGEEFGKTRCDFRKFKDVEEVKSEIAKMQPRGYYILIKGSNGIHLAELKELL
uniref:UDP-N-acetylmuramoyl-tripeptide--D-alanyl-D-alanine ligase n=1 Tax=Prevotella sp. GTC17254 TaxID=3236794 RepID=A0AB33J3X9_9BACT